MSVLINAERVFVFIQDRAAFSIQMIKKIIDTR